jgi:hypothetical protein
LETFEGKKPLQIKEKQEMCPENFVVHSKYSSSLFLSYYPVQSLEQMERREIN